MKILLKIKTDPRNIFVSSPNAPQQILSVGSIVKNTINKQKFVKKNGDQFAYAAVQTTPPVTWKWDSAGETAWKILQDLYAESAPNSAPTGLSLSSTSTQEEQTLVGTLSANDADIGDILTYSVVPDYADGASFTIINGNELHFAAAPDFEAKSQYTLKIRATDTDNAFTEEQYIIAVQQSIININENMANDFGRSQYYTQYGLRDIIDLTAYPTTGSIYLTISNYRNAKSQPYASFWGMLQYTKNQNSYTFNWLAGPNKFSRTKDEDGNTVANLTYPDVPSNFYVNINSSGIVQVFIPTYSEPNITSASVFLAVTDNDGRFPYEKKKIHLPIDSAITYSLPPGLLDNDSFEIIENGYTIQFKYMIDFETKPTYQIALAQTKDSITSTYIKTIHLIDRDDSVKYYSFNNSFSKNIYMPTQVWHASGAALQSGRYELAGSGEQNSSLSFGGRDNNARLQTTEKFNGSSWTSAANLLTGRGELSGCGGQDSTVAFGGRDANQNYSLTEKFDGNTWQTSGAMSVGKYGMGGCGTQNAALAFGGLSSAGALSVSETFDGLNWTTLSATLGESRYRLAGCGTQNAALAISGSSASSSPRFKTEKFNGSTWTTINSMYSPRFGHVGCGTQNAAVVFGGQTATEYSGTTNNEYNLTTQIYNGDSWSAASPMLLGRAFLGGAGQQSASVAFGGMQGKYYNLTEKFNGNNPYNNLESPTLVTPNLNLVLDTDTNPNYLTNVFTLSGTANDFFEIKNGVELHLKPTTTPSSYNAWSSFVIDSVDILQRKSRNYFSVSLLDMPIGPTDFNWQSSSSPVPGTIEENKPANTFVGALIPTDPNGANSYNSFYYSIVGGDGMGKFYFYNQYQKGFLYSSQSFDYEAKSSYTLIVRCTDVSGYYFEKSIVITVINAAN